MELSDPLRPAAGGVLPYARGDTVRRRWAWTRAALLAVTLLQLAVGLPLVVGGMALFEWSLLDRSGATWTVWLPVLLAGTAGTWGGVWSAVRRPGGWRRAAAAQLLLEAFDLYFVAVGARPVRHSALEDLELGLYFRVGGTVLLLTSVWVLCYLLQPAPRRAFGYSVRDAERDRNWLVTAALAPVAAFAFVL